MLYSLSHWVRIICSLCIVISIALSFRRISYTLCHTGQVLPATLGISGVYYNFCLTGFKAGKLYPESYDCHDMPKAYRDKMRYVASILQ